MSLETTQSVNLPKQVVKRVEDRITRTEFNSESEYITYVLEEVLYRVEQETRRDDVEPVNEEEVKDRLKSLGYLNE